MHVSAFLLLCFIPLVAFFLIFVLLIDGLKIRFALLASVLGLLAVLPIAFVQNFVLKLPVFNTNTVVSLLITAVVFNGVIEESLKMLFLLILPQKKMPLAAFFCCALLFGLALGTFESIIYLVSMVQSNALSGGLTAAYKLILLRMFSSVLIHTFCAGLSGLYIWMFKNHMNHVFPFIYATLLHGIYNFFAGFNSNYRWFSVIAILFALLECRIWYRTITKAEYGVRLKTSEQNA